MHAIYAPTAEIESILGDTSVGPRVASGEIWDPSSTFCSPIASDRDGKLEGKTEDEQDDGGLAELLSVQSEIQRQLVRVQEAMLSDCRVFSSLAARVAGGARSLQNPDLYRKQLARHTRNKSTTPLFVPFRPLNQQQRTETRHATHSSVFEGRSGDPRLPYVSAAAPAPRFLCASPSSGVSRIKRVSSARAAQAEQYNRLHLRVTNSARPDAATGRFSASTPVAASPQMNQVGRKRTTFTAFKAALTAVAMMQIPHMLAPQVFHILGFSVSLNRLSRPAQANTLADCVRWQVNESAPQTRKMYRSVHWQL
ncbi:hypothetical protein TGGT1_297440 [Toxoplasma gondii GT1]|uniref:Uncharacterized protein n=4 Tax=Toxoplasma gondii TaxID=5811 RepID=S7UKX4_TOXGG|nr:hypothetical protein TGGT1_297440 [Toxoplasma gondii GT1]KAF4645743.1 hypothetical protein TGRH88_002290 [Toxoplasma gondii]KFG39865.1 hypothetical protein TGFOU_297440 [Toxoplasma gondii FOU]RQX67422.1 hypothetical protein TGCAST_297440 [Toxoplasma gondii CAST]